MIKLWAARFAAASTIATFLCSSLASQTTILSDEKTALRVEQQAVFEQMFDKPDDLDLMFRYAIVSIQLEDLEAAISTLERMLIYNREIPRAHMELGAAYYRLGSYKTASYYFDNVLAFTDVPPQVRSRAEEFKRAIDQRTQKSVFRRVSQPACWRSAGKKKNLKIFDFELDITGASSGHAWGMGLSGSRRARAFLGRAAAASSSASRATSGETFLFEVSRAFVAVFWLIRAS